MEETDETDMHLEMAKGIAWLEYARVPSRSSPAPLAAAPLAAAPLAATRFSQGAHKSTVLAADTRLVVRLAGCRSRVW